MDKKKEEFGFNQRFFQGYSKHLVMTKNGKTKVEYVYDGIYYLYSRGAASWKKRKMLPLICTIIYSLLLFVGMAQKNGMNRLSGVIVVQMILLLIDLGLIFCSLQRCFANYRMTLWEYRMSYLSIAEFMWISMFIQILLVFISFICMIQGGMANWRACLSYFCAAIFLYFSANAVKKEKYSEEQSEDIPVGGMDVTAELTPEQYLQS